MEMTTALAEMRQKRSSPVLNAVPEAMPPAAPAAPPISAPAAEPKAAQEEGMKGRQVDKCTVVLDADVSMKLDIAAALRKMNRSAIINELLKDSLRPIQIRGLAQFEGSARTADRVKRKGREKAA